jgi:hypothetical protein
MSVQDWTALIEAIAKLIGVLAWPAVFVCALVLLAPRRGISCQPLAKCG